MDEQEKLLKQIEEQVAKQIKGFSKSEELDSVKQTLEDIKKDFETVKATTETIVKLEKAIKEQGEFLAKNPWQNVEQKEDITSILTKNQEQIKKAVENDQKGSVHRLFIPKTAILTTAVTSNPAGINIPDITRPGYQMPNMAQIMGSVPIPSGNNHAIGYWDRTTSTRNANYVAENNTTTDSAAAWTYATKTIEKIFDWIPFTKEAVYDIAWMRTEIEAFVRENLFLKEDYLLLHGTGTTPQIQGLYDIATTFDATDFAAKYDKGNLFNLILCVASKMSNGKNSLFKATHVVLNDTDFITMLANQNDFGSYDFPPFARLNPDGTINVGGITVVSNSNITADTMLVFDATKQKRYNNGIEIEIGYNAGDILYDRLTMVGRIREAVVIQSNYEAGFYKVTSIANDVDEITKV